MNWIYKYLGCFILAYLLICAGIYVYNSTQDKPVIATQNATVELKRTVELKHSQWNEWEVVKSFTGEEQ